MSIAAPAILRPENDFKKLKSFSVLNIFYKHKNNFSEIIFNDGENVFTKIVFYKPKNMF